MWEKVYYGKFQYCSASKEVMKDTVLSSSIFGVGVTVFSSSS
jgi:hypothetical protein